MKVDYCVDYLSYDWCLDDLLETYKKANCKNMNTMERIRYKNALWRSMSMKSKKLIDPSTVHWQKESDITWLYGPLYTTDPTKCKLASPKPVLKNKLIPACSDSSSSTSSTNHIVHFNPEIIEIEYQPEYPIQQQLVKEDELWSLVIQFIISLNTTFLKFILSYRHPMHLLKPLFSRKLMTRLSELW